MEALIPWLLSVLTYSVVIRGKYFNPTSVTWLLGGDYAQEFLGWHFFRNAPLWQLPLGLNQDLGEELGSSIVYTGSVPVFSFVFRPFSAILPHYFQYIGIWILVCFCLQGFFSWKLARHLTPFLPLRILICSFFLLAPPFLFRIINGNSVLAHWAILAAIHWLITDQQRVWSWVAILCLMALTHAYLLVMTGVLWIAYLLKVFLSRTAGARFFVVHLFAVPLLVSGTMWLAGYFVLKGGEDIGGYGVFRMNLTALFNSAGGWSHILTNQGTTPAEGEGFNYLGLGMWILAVLAAGTLLQAQVPLQLRTTGPILFIVLVLAPFAITNRIAWGRTELFSFPLMPAFQRIGDTFRGSGRMFWPVFYLLMLGIFWALTRHHRARVLTVVLTVALIIQLGDSWTAIAAIHSNMASKERWKPVLIAPFWLEATQRYRRIAYVLPDNNPPDYIPLALLAADHRMSINTGYWARMDLEALGRLRQKLTEEIEAGRYRPDTLYVFKEQTLWEAAVKNLREPNAAGVVDGFCVLAPRWAEFPSTSSPALWIGRNAAIQLRNSNELNQ